jgi:hypothetical protein
MGSRWWMGVEVADGGMGDDGMGDGGILDQ